MKNKFLLVFLISLFSLGASDLLELLRTEPVINLEVLKDFKRQSSPTPSEQKMITRFLDGEILESEDSITLNAPSSFKLAQEGEGSGGEGGGDGEGGGEIHREGSGTRGGGSGVAILTPSPLQMNPRLFKVERVFALEVYRSLFLKENPGFFRPLDEYRKTPKGMNEEEWSEHIINKIIDELEDTLPVFADFLRAARKDFAFESWTDVRFRLPLVHDYLGDIDKHPLLRQVQVAYRIHDQFVYDSFYYEKMDGFNRAALKLHEYIYANSSLSESLSTQRMVSLLLSESLYSQLLMIEQARNGEIPKDILNHIPMTELLILLGLSTLSQADFSLPNGVHQQSIEFESNWLCGRVMKFEFSKNMSTAKLFFTVDLNNPHIKLENFTIGGPQMIAGYSVEKIMEIRLNNEDQIKKIITAFAYAKFSLASQYPIYKYPSQFVPASVFCFTRYFGKIKSMEVGLTWDENKNKSDLTYARAEVEYLKALGRQHQYWESHKLKDVAANNYVKHIRNYSQLNQDRELKQILVKSSKLLTMDTPMDQYFKMLGINLTHDLLDSVELIFE